MLIKNTISCCNASPIIHVGSILFQQLAIVNLKETVQFMSIFNLNYKTQIHLRFYVLNQQTNNYMCVLCLDLNLKSKTLQIYNKIFKIKTKDYVKCSIYKKHKPNYDFICFISKFNISKCSWL